MVTGIIGKKVGMTQLFLEDGTLEPATVLQAGPCIVVQSKSGQTDGYDAVQIGLVEKNPPRRATKATTGHHQKANVPPTRVQREVKLAKGGEAPKPGDQVLVSMFNRAPGSIGASSYPSRVMPGMRAHGHMGVDRVTVRNLKVLKIDSENHLIIVKGAVPGANGGYVVIRKAVAAKPEPQPQLQEKPKKGKK